MQNFLFFLKQRIAEDPPLSHLGAARFAPREGSQTEAQTEVA